MFGALLCAMMNIACFIFSYEKGVVSLLFYSLIINIGIFSTISSIWAIFSSSSMDNRWWKNLTHVSLITLMSYVRAPYSFFISMILFCALFLKVIILKNLKFWSPSSIHVILDFYLHLVFSWSIMLWKS